MKGLSDGRLGVQVTARIVLLPQTCSNGGDLEDCSTARTGAKRSRSSSLSSELVDNRGLCKHIVAWMT